MLFNPFKKQFNFPSMLIKLCDLCCFKMKIVCKENKKYPAFIIIEFYPANFLRIIFSNIEIVKQNALITEYSIAFVRWIRFDPPTIHVVFSPKYIKSLTTMNPIKSLVVYISSIHYINAIGLIKNKVQSIHVINRGRRKMDELRDSGFQI